MVQKALFEGVKLYPGEGGVTAPLGFTANGISCGIKLSGAKDLGIVFSPHPCNAAGIFTSNTVKGAPLKVSKANISNKIHAVVLNSGNANVCTGREGIHNVREIGRRFGEEFDVPPGSILYASTGVIGVPLPMESIIYGITKLKRKMLVENNSGNAADAILTTDTKRKMAKVTCPIGGKLITIGAIAKGSGMISPNMATVLAILTSDAHIAPKMMQRALRAAAKQTFNKITVDGQMSPNDSVLMLANARQNNAIINRPGAQYSVFEHALIKLCEYLAFEIINDGAGVSKVITIVVKGAFSKAEAELAARAIASSPIFKASTYGHIANWGSVLQAIGAVPITMDPDRVCIEMNGAVVCENGSFNDFKSNGGRTLLNKRNINVVVDLAVGKASDFVITTDLTYDYVKINSQYM
jgi:glutamate N-acetyltransferase/amino-acid N-acetyltransferase